MRIETLTGAALTEALDDVARLRIAAFRDWPYLYDGDYTCERRYRGRGIMHRFFDLSEDYARSMGYEHIRFAFVVRAPNHPLRPSAYRSIDSFWDGRGYARLPGVAAHFPWKDVDQPDETEKALQFWMRAL